MCPPGIRELGSSSTGLSAPRGSRPVRASRAQAALCSGCASTESSEGSVAATAAALWPVGVGPANSRAGMCRPNTVSVCAPYARSSGPRIAGRSASGSRPRTAAGRDRPAGGLLVRARQLRIALVDVERAGERVCWGDVGIAKPRQPASSRLSFSCEPSGGSSPVRARAACRRPPGRRWRARRSLDAAPRGDVTSAPTPSVSIDTPRPAAAHDPRPARAATAASASVSAPMPPTGTSHRPVPLPITWYRKQRFWRAARSSAAANVPIGASVSATPRTRSDETCPRASPTAAARTAAPYGLVVDQPRSSSRARSGSVIVANSRGATPAIVS